MSRPRVPPFFVGLFIGLILVGGSLLAFKLFVVNGADPVAAPPPPTTDVSPPIATQGDDGAEEPAGEQPTTSPAVTTTETTIPFHRFVDRRSVGQPWGSVEGLLTFRGNPTGTYYGEGPVPQDPRVLWRYPDQPMCSESTNLGVTKVWCGNGWTGQPVIWVRPDGVTELIFGAYDRKLHFVDAATGQATRAPFLTGDLVKGTPTIDPNGYPLVYFGSRDNKLRILALDREEPTELWNVEANLSVAGMWNDDWDASPRIIDDIMFEGAENSIFYVYKLHRGYDADGKVSVAPEKLFEMEAWTDELLQSIAGTPYPRAVSIESSTALYEGRAYFANSGGRVVGLYIENVESGQAPVVLDFWVGDDVDATIVIDEEGMLYVAAEYERFLPRARELGQLIKLNPYRPNDPFVWGVPARGGEGEVGGIWATPALGDGVIYAATQPGNLIAVDTETGEEFLVDRIGRHAWSSPVVVDDTLIAASCTEEPGQIHAYSLEDPRAPRPLWTFQPSESCIEATPAVWHGVIYVGSRDGYLYAVGD
ncbi:MAG: PQQ-binding-like beta-propeller repeat protein [Acidimicrobiia bacterium]